jgi:hypothetical protein
MTCTGVEDFEAFKIVTSSHIKFKRNLFPIQFGGNIVPHFGENEEVTVSRQSPTKYYSRQALIYHGQKPRPEIVQIIAVARLNVIFRNVMRGTITGSRASQNLPICWK